MKILKGCLTGILLMLMAHASGAIAQQDWEQTKAGLLSLIESGRSYEGTEVRILVGEILDAADDAIQIAAEESSVAAQAQTLREILPELQARTDEVAKMRARLHQAWIWHAVAGLVGALAGALTVALLE